MDLTDWLTFAGLIVAWAVITAGMLAVTKDDNRPRVPLTEAAMVFGSTAMFLGLFALLS